MGSDSNGNKYLERKYSKTVDTMQKKKKQNLIPLASLFIKEHRT